MRSLGPRDVADFDEPVNLYELIEPRDARRVSLPEVVRAADVAPAELVGLDVGTLRPGAPADVAILARERGRFSFADVEGDTREGDELLRCERTIVAGRLLEPRPEPPPAPWIDV